MHPSGNATIVPSDSTPIEGTSSGAASTIATGATQQPDENQTVENLFAGEVVQKIQTIIESYRTSKVRKSQAVVQIAQLLAAESSGSELVNIPGNLRVNFSDPYPYPLKPGPLVNRSGFNQVRVKGSRVSRV